MFWLDPWQFLLVFVLDFLIGHPEDWPHLAKLKQKLAVYYERTFARTLGRSMFAGFLFWFVIIATILGCYACLVITFDILPGHLRWWFDAFILYQCVMVFEVDRQVRSVIRPLAAGQTVLSQDKLAELTATKTEKYSSQRICEVTGSLLHECVLTNLIGPLFWAMVLGAPGILLYKTSQILVGLVDMKNPAYVDFGRAPGVIFSILDFFPRNIAAILYRKLGFPSQFVNEEHATQKPEQVDMVLNEWWRLTLFSYGVVLFVASAYWIVYMLFFFQEHGIII